MSPISVSAAILAGGKSTRMRGEDKSLLILNGIPFVESIRKRLGDCFTEIFVVSDRSRQIKEMGFSVFPDLISDKGPLGGLYTALSVSASNKVLLVACDMPLLKESFVRNFVMSASDEDIFIPLNNSNPEPLFAIYDKDCLPAIIEKIQCEELEMTSFFSELNVRYLEEKTWRQWDADGISFQNINTPSDFENSKKLNERDFEN
tara:strand:- start:349 stop:960 length:612 start_codon:yes stop_codon:yes gene_type:complete